MKVNEDDVKTYPISPQENSTTVSVTPQLSRDNYHAESMKM